MLENLDMPILMPVWRSVKERMESCSNQPNYMLPAHSLFNFNDLNFAS